VEIKEAEALRAEGLNPDDAAVIAALDLVRWEFSLGNRAFLATRVDRCRVSPSIWLGTATWCSAMSVGPLSGPQR
jgi:hypothetical protein